MALRLQFLQSKKRRVSIPAETERLTRLAQKHRQIGEDIEVFSARYLASAYEPTDEFEEYYRKVIKEREVIIFAQYFIWLSIGLALGGMPTLLSLLGKELPQKISPILSSGGLANIVVLIPIGLIALLGVAGTVLLLIDSKPRP